MKFRSFTLCCVYCRAGSVLWHYSGYSGVA